MNGTGPEKSNQVDQLWTVWQGPTLNPDRKLNCQGEGGNGVSSDLLGVYLYMDTDAVGSIVGEARREPLKAGSVTGGCV